MDLREPSRRRTCKNCDTRLNRRNTSGLCVPHWQEHIRTPEWRAKVSETQRRILLERPELKARRQELGRRMAALPATAEARRNSFVKNELWKLGLAACTPESRKLAGRRLSETRLAWCPPELRDDYRRLITRHKIKAAEARQMILAQHDTNMARFRNAIAPPKELPVELREPPRPKPSKPGLSEEALLAGVGAAFGYTLEDILGRARQRPLARARQTAYAVLHARGYDYSQIAAWLGRDRSTIIYGCKMFPEFARRDARLAGVFHRFAPPVKVTA